ncbi:hypothetical protein CVD19_16405 [Bacillus sp. T33-2]|nr:hypothetical protein CVD19_16405 [Bacillus sp. T33-2]
MKKDMVFEREMCQVGDGYEKAGIFIAIFLYCHFDFPAIQNIQTANMIYIQYKFLLRRSYIQN